MCRLLALALLAVALGACGGRQSQAPEGQGAQPFECKQRYVSYIATNHLGGGEIGVQVDCAEVGPRVKRWRSGRDGNRIEDARGMTPAEFDETWNAVDGSGWAYLKDCENGTAGAHDPIYVFDMHDDEQNNSFQCQSRSMPFPYNTIVDPLDVAAQKGREQLGDPEPAPGKKGPQK